jgi:protein SCO1/2
MSSRWGVNVRLLLLLLVFAFFAAPVLAHLPIPPKKGEIGRKAVQTVVPDFTLVDQDGKPFRFSEARGNLILLTFVFTTCPDLCPLLTAKFAAIQRALEKQKRNDYLLLSMTTDPDRDSPAALKSYADRYKADFRRWLFLTGSRGQLKKAWDEFGVSVRKSTGGEIQHTTLTTLIDPHGVRRFDYYTDKWQEKEILKDIASLGSPQ